MISRDGFNLFLDRHLDPKEIQEELVKKKLATFHPFRGKDWKTDVESGFPPLLPYNFCSRFQVTSLPATDASRTSTSSTRTCRSGDAGRLSGRGCGRASTRISTGGTCAGIPRTRDLRSQVGLNPLLLLQMMVSN